MDTPRELDTFHTHEALDRCHLMSDMIQNHLLDHTFIAAHPEIRAKIMEAVDLLESVYQEIGSIHAQEP